MGLVPARRSRTIDRVPPDRPTKLTAALRVDGAVVRCDGHWTLAGIEGLARAWAAQRATVPQVRAIDGSAIRALDTAGALLLLQLEAAAGGSVGWEGFAPEDAALVELVRERRTAAGEAPPPTPPEGVLARLGRTATGQIEQATGFLDFLGEAAAAMLRVLLSPRRVRGRALLKAIEEAGANAMPIVGLLTFLIGVVVAYQGGQLLKTYGANIFIVDMVTLTMVREMAPLIVAIIVAGRTGSAYTAQIGTMQVTEEVDALRTIGIQPMELLVLPKVIALLIALPLLTLFADVLSVMGGMLVARTLLDIGFVDFIERVPAVLSWRSLLVGVGKAPVFAVIIALVGCYQGFQVRGGADSVGRQTTVSVVQSIFLVIIVDAILVINFGSWGLR
jgi:phospholipid/cholesterol/gamma-HCH transport system permease protein